MTASDASSASAILDRKLPSDKRTAILLMSLAALMVVMALSVIVQLMQGSQLPAPFTIRANDAVVNHVTGTKDPVEKLRIAVTVAERVGLPVYATESCEAKTPQLPKMLCGRSFLVTYQHARRLAPYQGSVQLNIPVVDGDFIDAGAGVYRPGPRPAVTTVTGVVVTAPPIN